MNELIYEGYFALFLIITLGIMLGAVRFRGFSLDLSAVVFVALILGHYGIMVPEAFQTIGLMFFIFTVGIQAGPGFFDAFRKAGRQYLGVCLLLISTAALLSFGLSRIFGLDPLLGVGIFNGALTSTSGLAAAIDISGSTMPSIGYGIVYPAGAVLAILVIHLLPLMFRVNMKAEERKYIEKSHEDHPDVTECNFVVENKNIDGKTIRELGVGSMTRAVISRIKHGNEVFTPGEKTRLFLGDIVKIVGTEEALQKAALMIGPKTTARVPQAAGHKINWVLVTNKEVISKSLKELNLTAFYNATITRIRRSGIDISPSGNTLLRFGDKLLIASDNENMVRVMQLLGNNEKRLSETNFLPISLGIIIGVLLGAITFPIFGLLEFNLGITGGVLITALVLSKIGKTGPVIWTMSGGANSLLRKLGLLMFLATVGTHAGAHIAEALKEYGWTLLWTGMSITIIPMVVTTLIGHFVLRINFATLLGVVAGSMTSTPALAAADAKTETDAASLGYATVYPLAIVLMIIFSKILSVV
ncbi:MAG: aspartate:alanine exchanger family transporter [Bacteroidales bacterium]|nr:aspartate:alanine exchanger family transporter [Bacteroidales bacterium]